ncbi:energy transducer TonB [Pontibacter mangrovi]|uniref:TonB C-terminal domain-containing protein n=1 Tax=Pontibacter mangrovi TaxID=2589816 RepID=A0A501W3L2_9BACT|nr:hypothetical protein [Pontibacter mangrovi]TPE44503.1 hypothetical protein FJM65_10215 [Pontibacter mangrovi]
MKEWAFFIVMIAFPLLGYSQKKVFFKPHISYDTAQVKCLGKTVQVDNSDTLNNVFFDDLEFCIKFKGGEEALVKYLVDSFQVPVDDKHHNISGKVLASFTVNEKGEVGDIKIEEGLCEEIDNEVIRDISEMPKWIWDCETKPRRSYKTKRFAPFIIH